MKACKENRVYRFAVAQDNLEEDVKRLQQINPRNRPKNDELRFHLVESEKLQLEKKLLLLLTHNSKNPM
jgi:hypothetical protein